eukprot:gene17303-8881_t
MNSEEKITEKDRPEIAGLHQRSAASSAASTRSIDIGLAKTNGGFVDETEQAYQNVEQKQGSLYMLPNAACHNEDYDTIQKTLPKDEEDNRLDRFHTVELTMGSSNRNSSVEGPSAGSTKLELPPINGKSNRENSGPDIKFAKVTFEGNFYPKQNKTNQNNNDFNNGIQSSREENGTALISGQNGKYAPTSNGVCKHGRTRPVREFFSFPCQCLIYVAASCLLAIGFACILVALL